MPKFQTNVPHTLSQQDAIERMNQFTETVGKSDQVSDLEQSWHENQLHFGFKTYGIPLKGVVTVTDNNLEVTGDLPFSAMMFKGKIEGEIQKVLGKLMAA